MDTLARARQVIVDAVVGRGYSKEELGGQASHMTEAKILRKVRRHGIAEEIAREAIASLCEDETIRAVDSTPVEDIYYIPFR